MTVTIFHVNVRGWRSNKYALSIEASSNNSDIILINDLSTPPNFNINLQGYHAISKSQGQHKGVAILIRDQIAFQELPVLDINTLAIRLHTNLGPIIICTSYIPPSIKTIPSVAFNKLLNFNLPTLFIADLNAHHPHFFNTSGIGDSRGKQLFALTKSRNLSHLGPPFPTYITHQHQTNPDIILCNSKFKIYHYQALPGKPIGSDHIPIIFKIQIKPFITVNKPNHNYNKVQINQYKSELENDQFENLEGLPIDQLNNRVKIIFDNIIKAANNNSPTYTHSVAKTYHPTPQIRLKLRQLQSAYACYYNFGYPNTTKLAEIRNQLNILVSQHKSHNWDKIIKIAEEKHSKPAIFWKIINKMLHNKKEFPSYLTEEIENDDSDSSDFGETITNYIIDPINQAKYISKTWENICKPNTGAEFSNPNTKRVQAWHRDNHHLLQHKMYISLAHLREDHPLLRPVTVNELINYIKLLKDKSPGPSGITSILIKNLPANYIRELRLLFSYLISTRFHPELFKISKTIFILKPQKSKYDPKSYRPISLLELIAKLYEKIIGNRLLYFFEHNNLFKEQQFGFRPGHSTEQSINLIVETIKENKRQNKFTMVTTRDVEKAFDKLWHQGLIYKLSITYNIELDFVSIIFNYLINRIVIPYFNSIKGPSYTPLAGVPQGSCLGPILFIIFVNDAPNPLYHNTVTAQFADDMVHVVRSDQTGHNRIENAKKKLINELKLTDNWEKKWKIKTNTSKIKIGIFGTSIEYFETYGGIRINKIPIKVNTSIKILGYTIDNNLNSVIHIKSAISIASRQLSKLNKFKHAPPKIKLQLYKALVSPYLDRPSIQLDKAPKTYISKLQLIQNRALRWAYNINLTDRVPTEQIHLAAKIDPINIRLAKLARKIMFKMKDFYFDNEDNPDITYLKLASLTDFYNNSTPVKPKQPSLAYKINNNIFQHYLGSQINILNLPENWEDYSFPQPSYK